MSKGCKSTFISQMEMSLCKYIVGANKMEGRRGYSTVILQIQFLELYLLITVSIFIPEILFLIFLEPNWVYKSTTFTKKVSAYEGFSTTS